MGFKGHFSKDFLPEFLVTFLVCTGCICILDGIFGVIAMPDVKLGYDAFLSPPLFAFFAVLFGTVTHSRKELNFAQVIRRRCLHLILVELLVFGLNLFYGVVFPIKTAIALALCIAIVFIAVYVIMYLNDQRSAWKFNKELKRFQEKNIVP